MWLFLRTPGKWPVSGFGSTGEDSEEGRSLASTHVTEGPFAETPGFSFILGLTQTRELGQGP